EMSGRLLNYQRRRRRGRWFSSRRCECTLTSSSVRFQTLCDFNKCPRLGPHVRRGAAARNHLSSCATIHQSLDCFSVTKERRQRERRKFVVTSQVRISSVVQQRTDHSLV